jgi:hypothetical protein
MKKFYAIYKTPVSVIEGWMTTPEAERKAMQTKMEAEWQAWAQEHASMIEESAGLGKTQIVSPSGITSAKNDLMMYTIVNADSAEEAAKIFVGHPHLQIPQSTIEIMEANKMPGMK